MAIIVRIVSADGKAVSREFPALPKRLKVPAGAKVEVIDKESGEVQSLSQYVNEHTDRDGGNSGVSVSIEPADNLPASEAWLHYMSRAMVADAPAQEYFATKAEEGDGGVFGFDRETLVLGGLVGIGGTLAIVQAGKGDKDRVAPVAPTALDLDTADDTGTSSDNITSKTTGLTIRGTAEAGSTVELFDGTTSLGTVIADANGVFLKDVDLGNGEHTVTAVAKDNAGNKSAESTGLKITVDATVPVTTSLDLAAEDDTGVNDDNITAKTSGLTITGKSEAGAKVELFDGTTSLGTVTAAADGSFTKDISLTAAGDHTITAKATDTAGNIGAASDALTIKIDTTTPSGLDLAAADDTGASDSDNITSKTTGLTITGKAEAGKTIELFDGATSLGTVIADSSGNFTRDIDLAPGAHAVTAKVSGSATASDALGITVDQSIPEIDMAAADDTGKSNSDNVTSQSSGLTITGKAQANTTIEVFDGAASLGTVTVAADGTFSKDIDLTAGSHAISARTVGGATSGSLIVTVDTTAPTAPSAPDLAFNDDSGSSDTDNITMFIADLTITGTAEASSTVELFDGATSLGTVTAGTDGNYTRNIGLAEGVHTITTKAIDAAGNVGPASPSLTITVDRTAPASVQALDLAAEDDNGVANSDNMTSQTSGLTITGQAEAGTMVELFDGATSLGTVLVGANGSFTRDISLALGSHQISARATDVAGNLGAAATALTVTIVSAAPPPETIDDTSAYSHVTDLGLYDSSTSFG